jgi:hypothetical protein
MNIAIGGSVVTLGLLATITLTYLGVRWRSAAAGFPIGFAAGGLFSRMMDFLPFWAELMMWGWFGISSYAVLLWIGYVNRPWWEEQGFHW